MANNVLPEELMLCILTRLPVKTIVRFKSVCKPWHHLFSTPEFQKMHQGQFSSDPQNQSFILHSFNKFSIFNSESGKKRPTILDHPFAHDQKIELDTVGCCNGLVCIRSDQEIVLWNPAMKLSKTIPLKDCGPFKMVSLGFGYDAIGDDFKVVMIVANGVGEPLRSEIYSVNLGSWITIDVDFLFRLYQTKNDLIVNGNPYWVAWGDDDNQVLVCFDVLELVFKIVPWPTNYWMSLNEVAGADVDMDNLLVFEEETEIKTWAETERVVELVDWNGAIGALMIKYEVEYSVDPLSPFTECSVRIECVRVLVFDDIERIWRNDHTCGPIKVDVHRGIYCSKNGKVMGTLSSGTLFLLDLETGCVKELFDEACFGSSFEVYGYTESLAYINGMEKVVVKYEPNDLDD
ncbi:hypothetical protein CASFOL_013240 [Castilleja foliolosa]|uniref:F-box domain-containing protein n=1 Tax=Castilleja foliolosa TaxID=1961234 RepID=A0ABD3DJG4_9LAMI